MARKVKSSYVGGRVDEDTKEEVQEYIDNMDMTEGQLIRKAIKEYMNNHPVPQEV